MMASWARPGVKVVYIGVPEWAKPDYRGIQALGLGRTYTIRDTVLWDLLCIRLEEVVNPVIKTRVGFTERAYPLICFRPLVTKTQEQDVELFRHLLTSANTPEHV